MSLKIYCFGEFEVYLNEGRIPGTRLGGAKARHLLKILLTQPDVFLTKDQLIELLWNNNHLPKNPERTLRNYIHQLRRSLEPETNNGETYQLIRTGEDGYGFFMNGNCWIDTQAFEAHLETGEELISQQRWDEATDCFQQAVALYRDDFLKDDLYEEWSHLRRADLQEKYCHALSRLAEGYAQREDWTKAIDCCHKVVALTPGHEGIHRQLMLYYCFDGNRDRAIKTFETLESYLKDEVKVEPEAQTIALHQRILNGEISSRDHLDLESMLQSKTPFIVTPPGAPEQSMRWYDKKVLIGSFVIVGIVVIAFIWNFLSSRSTPSEFSAPPIQFFQNEMTPFFYAGDFPPVKVDFEDIEPGTDLTGKTINGVRFEKSSTASASLIVVPGSETFTPDGYRCEPFGDRDMLKLFPTTGMNVLSPGGAELAPGPNPALEDDDLVMIFENPINAISFDILWQSADGSERTITLQDENGNILLTQSVKLALGTLGVAPPGGTSFVGFVSPINNISKVIVDEFDNDDCRENANAGYDSIRFKAISSTPPQPSEPGYAFLRQWGSPGANPGQFSVDSGPRGVALVNEDGITFVYESDYVNNRIQKFDTEGRFIDQFPLSVPLQDIDYDEAQEAFYVRAVGYLVKLDANLNVVWMADAPAAEWVSYGLCIDSDGNIHVPVTITTAPVDHKMHKYDPDGNLLAEYGAGMVKGSSNCEASRDGFVYVSDGTTSNLRKFANSGELQETIEIGYDIRAIAIDRNTDEIFLVIGMSEKDVKVRKFDPNFKLLAEWGGKGEGSGLFSYHARDIEIDQQGFVYVNDGENYLIQVFEPN